MLARDPAALAATFADDVVLRSPVAARPFRGRERVADVMTELIAALDELEYTAVVDGGDVHVLAFRMRLDGRVVEAVDLLRFDADGRVREIVVHARPLAATAHVMAVVRARRPAAR